MLVSFLSVERERENVLLSPAAGISRLFTAVGGLVLDDVHFQRAGDLFTQSMSR